MTSPIRRKSRLSNWTVVAFVGIVIVVWFWPRKTTADPSVVRSGDHRLAAINADASIKLTVPLSDSKLGQLDVRWLGIDIMQPEPAAAWLRQQLDQADEITVRLDRRRIDKSGNLQAYFYFEGRLLNAELVGKGFAQEDTHPSDFAPISRQIRKAKELEQ